MAKVVGFVDGAKYFKRFLKVICNKVGPSVQLIQNPRPVHTNVLCYTFWGNNHKQYEVQQKVKTVFICGEPENVKRKAAKCALLIDCKLTPHLRPENVPFVYFPFYVLSFWERYHNKPEDLILPEMFNGESVLATKTKFCAFMYSQNVAFRNALYDRINVYKAVDALGSCRNKNPKKKTDRSHYVEGKSTYLDLAVQKYKPYKFVICCENSRHPGYITEKIINAMLAHAIPIYLGAPDVVQHFNPNSFIHVGDDIEGAIKKIQELDTNPKAYAKMLEEPWLISNQFSSFFNVGPVVSAFRYLLNTNNPVAAKPVAAKPVAAKLVTKRRPVMKRTRLIQLRRNRRI